MSIKKGSHMLTSNKIQSHCVIFILKNLDNISKQRYVSIDLHFFLPTKETKQRKTPDEYKLLKLANTAKKS